MTPEHWEQIKRLFHESLTHEPAQLSAFLTKMCGEDVSLCHEIEALIASYEQSDDFIETPASDIAAALLAEEQSGLAPGEMVGPFTITSALATGGLVRADKRFSRGYQLLASWAYSSNTGINAVTASNNTAVGFNLDDWFGNRGPLANDITHILNLAGVVQLPWSSRLGFNFSYSSTPPFSPFVDGIDFNGDGTKGDLLPGTTVNAFNRSMGREELPSLITQFNQTYAGQLDGKGVVIPRLTLPERYWFGDNFQSLDFRLSREFVFRERWRFTLIGEVFNVYNAANLSGHSGNLTNATRPTDGTLHAGLWLRRTTSVSIWSKDQFLSNSGLLGSCSYLAADYGS